MHFGVVMIFWACIIQHYGEKERERESECVRVRNKCSCCSSSTEEIFLFFQNMLPKIICQQIQYVKWFMLFINIEF